MRLLRSWIERLKGLPREFDARERELADELESHIQMHVDDNVRAGMSPQEARKDAIHRLGGIETVKQAYRERSTVPSLENVLQDFRFAVRQLRKNPGFTFTAVVVFALGIAASTAIFAFVNAALIKPLPYRDPSRLVGLFESIPLGDRYHLSEDDYLDWKQLNHTFASIDIYEGTSFTVNDPSGLQREPGALVSAGFFRTLGVVPMLGRDFNVDEDKPSAEQAVLLSYGTWQKRFGSNRDVVGKTTTLNGVPFVIVGVLPPGFHFAPVEPAGFWATTHGDCRDGRDCHKYFGVGRLRDGTALTTGAADLSAIAEEIELKYPISNRDRGATVLSLSDVILGDIRPILLALLCGAALLLLIGFVNVSSLLLVRADSRRREIAVRGALGATRARLVRQFAVEGFMLAAVGCGLGLIVGFRVIRILSRLIPRTVADGMPYLQQVHFDASLFLFAAAVSILAWIVFTAGPTLQLFLTDMHDGLVGGGGRTAASTSWQRVGRGLVVIELAVAMVLLVSAGLLGKSFYRLLHVDIGMAADHLATMHIFKLGGPKDQALIELQRGILARMTALPGTTSAGISSHLAIGDGDGIAHYRVLGRAYLGQEDEANDRAASVGYFETLKVRLTRGRYFTEGDAISKPQVVLINQTMARQTFAGEDPLGKRLVNQYDKDSSMEVIGVIDDVKEGPLDAKARAAVYVPFNQSPENPFYVTVRTSSPATTALHAMISAVHQLDGGLIADGEDTMTERIRNSQSAYLHRCAASVVAGFAALALLLGAVGLYGVISYSVGQRTREIGVRIALGAQRLSVYKLILREATWLAVFGIAGGTFCSLAAARLLRSMLFGVSPWDMGTILSVAFTLTASGLLASYIPARRAASINPTEALRSD
jgi:macrolide transport system ATP-binding/permease protein